MGKAFSRLKPSVGQTIKITYFFKRSRESSGLIQDLSWKWLEKNWGGGENRESFVTGLVCTEGYTTAESVTFILQYNAGKCDFNKWLFIIVSYITVGDVDSYGSG
jgi:hypothetical protein